LVSGGGGTNTEKKKKSLAAEEKEEQCSAATSDEYRVCVASSFGSKPEAESERGTDRSCGSYMARDMLRSCEEVSLQVAGRV
jgi:hypothetical protein